MKGKPNVLDAVNLKETSRATDLKKDGTNAEYKASGAYTLNSGGAAPEGAPPKSGGRGQAAALRDMIFSVLRAMVTLAAAVIVVSYLWMPIFRIVNFNMEPTLQDGNYVLAVKTSSFHRGDIAVFYFNNKILVKRVIGLGGDVINIGADGAVTVNGVALSEPYVSTKSVGKCDIQFPYTVPGNYLFVMGDNREASMDSRVSMIGPVGMEQVAGKAAVRLWPMSEFGIINRTTALTNRGLAS